MILHFEFYAQMNILNKFVANHSEEVQILNITLALNNLTFNFFNAPEHLHIFAKSW